MIQLSNLLHPHDSTRTTKVLARNRYHTTMIMHYRDDDEDSNDDFMGNMGGYDSQSNPLGLSKAELRKVCVERARMPV